MNCRFYCLDSFVKFCRKCKVLERENSRILLVIEATNPEIEVTEAEKAFNSFKTF